MTRAISLLGSTGSIGRQTLEVCQEITLADCRTLPLFHRLLQSIYRLFAPLF